MLTLAPQVAGEGAGPCRTEMGIRRVACGVPSGLCSYVVLAREAAEDWFSPGPGSLQIDDLRGGMVGVVVGDVLADALVWSRAVVVGGVLGQDGAQACLVDDQGPVEQFAA